MCAIVRSLFAFALAGALLGACSAGATTAPSSSPTPTPLATTDGQGDEFTTGTESVLLTTPYTPTKVGDVTQLRGGVVTITETMNDPRANGTGTLQFSIDIYTKVGSEWGTYHLANANGSWDGPCTGGSWDEGNSAARSCWLVGSGGYKGYTFYLQATLGGGAQGVIYPGSAPKP